MGGVKVHPSLTNGIEFIAGAAVGVVAAAFTKQMIQTGFKTAPLWVAGAVQVGAAAAAIMTIKKQTPLVMGLEAGFGGMGAGFLLNETVISLPGISGMPPASANMLPGYISHAVNGYRGIPQNRMGNFSGGGAHSVNGLYTN